MVRKRRQVRKKRRSKSSSRTKEDAGKLFSKAKDLLLGMQDEGDDYGHVDVAEQVRRLKQKQEDDRPLDDVWGTKKRSSSWLWIILAGVIASVIVAVVAFTMMVDQGGTVDDQPVGIEDDIFTPIPEPLGDGPLDWFNENSVEVLDRASGIIETFNKPEEGGTDQLDKLIRTSIFRGADPVNLESWGSGLKTNSLSGFQWRPTVVYSSEATGSKERGFLSLSGKREDGNPYEVFFVNEDNRLLLDWDASMGWSEMSITEMVKEKPRKDLFLRCRVAKKPSYDQSFGDTPYSGYVLSGSEADEFVFGYVSLDYAGGKAIERDLRLLLNYGSFVTDQPPLVDQKVTLRVKFNEQIGEAGHFEIIEYLNDGWVRP